MVDPTTIVNLDVDAAPDEDRVLETQDPAGGAGTSKKIGFGAQAAASAFTLLGVGTVSTAVVPISANAKIGFTSIGGLAIKLTNTTGAVTIAGQTVKADPATNDAVILTGANDDEVMGVFLEAGVADDAEAWVVIAGIADVAFDDDEAAARGDWIGTGEAGYVQAQAAAPGAVALHFQEVGHVIETVAAGGGGTHITARCVLQWN